NVVNIAIELNGQQPLQVYIRPNKNFNIVCYSIDMGTTEVLHTYEDIRQYNKVGSAFSIPRAALALAGFLPDFCSETYSSLQQQLENFGAGLDITLLAAIPAGSGLGTSSILSSAILSALSDCCGLSWTKNHICELTLILEQMLTTGGGWQDQYGGILHGAKLLQTTAGVDQKPMINWLPETLFHQEDYRACHLLYYTGITRTAKNILEKIVRNMFLNEAEQLRQLEEMKQHAIEMSNAIMKNDLTQYGQQLRTTWTENCKLDKDTCPPLIAQLCNVIDDYCLGYKLPGAGGGGYMYMVAKDAQAASLIRQKLTEHPITPSARFVEMNISAQGLQISRS
ncbi:MAG: bifunctional fucokinase/L-fucose-1-P-guanylyltransferase, partial [Bacteroidaceae bacterium]|nr:bifunctional fucokinase/L-fucose-1-P-guanylyltransferase [Bacteroidaceae bacterium]